MTVPLHTIVYSPLWNEQMTRLVPHDVEHKSLELAVKEYFLQLDSQQAAEKCAAIHCMLEAFLAHDGNVDDVNTVKKAILFLQDSVQITAQMYAYILVLQVANALLDAEGEGLAKACAAQGQPFVCQKGCTGCCHQMVLCSEVEAALIALYLEAHSAKKAQFLKNVSYWQHEADAISASYVRWGQAFYGEGKDDGSHCREDYYIACPFLDASGACYIYEVRPYACRSSVAVDKKCVESCKTAQGNRQGMHNMLFSLFTGHHKARQALMHRFEHTKKDLHKTIMPYMVLNALNQ